ncbi:MAG: cyclic nucleotide-binding domain-containing protein [Planctomycetes bacterium]|nr:cyclic nucleotide-binding domain-containing protein [Planctomycetota bacterium]
MTQLQALHDSRLFADLTEMDMVQLDNIAEERRLTDGQCLFARGDEARELMVVLSGSVQLELPVSILGESRSVNFETKGRGEVVGWSALVPPYRFTLSARAKGGASVLAFPRTELASLFDSDPALGCRLMRNLAAIIGQRLHGFQSMWAREVQRSLDERYR